MPNVKELNINNTTYDIIGKGVVDQNNTTPLKQWSGTKNQYDALVSGGTIDSNTIYNITDDTDVTLSILSTLYPVGAIYIGTMSTCPLSVLGIGTWVKVSEGRVLQGSNSGHSAGSTIEAGLPNITGIIGQGDCAAGTYNVYRNGCFYSANTSTERSYMYDRLANVLNILGDNGFDASLSNSIYGNSNTVQPPAYIVNIWERIE